jgi:transposase-like protein
MPQIQLYCPACGGDDFTPEVSGAPTSDYLCSKCGHHGSVFTLLVEDGRTLEQFAQEHPEFKQMNSPDG